LIEGTRILKRKVRRYRPAIVAIVGIMAYRIAFQRPKAQLGRQEEGIDDAVVWVLPNPSGLNAHFRPAELGELFAELRRAAAEDSAGFLPDIVPAANLPVPRSGRQPALPREAQAENLVGMLERSPFLPGRSLPEEDHAGPVPVAVAAGESLAVGGKRDGPH